MSSGAPALIVEVRTPFVSLVATVVSPRAVPAARMTMTAARPVEASRVRMVRQIPFGSTGDRAPGATLPSVIAEDDADAAQPWGRRKLIVRIFFAVMTLRLSARTPFGPSALGRH